MKFFRLLLLVALAWAPQVGVAQTAQPPTASAAAVVIDLAGRVFPLGEQKAYQQLKPEEQKAALQAGYKPTDLVWLKWTSGGLGQTVVPPGAVGEGPDFELKSIRVGLTPEGRPLQPEGIAVARKPLPAEALAAARRLGYALGDPIYVTYQLAYSVGNAANNPPVLPAGFREVVRLLPAKEAPKKP